MSDYKKWLTINEDVKSVLIRSANTGAAAVAFVPGNGNRIRLTVTANITSDVAVGNDTVLIGVMDANTFHAVGAITVDSPFLVLRIEEIGEIIRQPFLALSLLASAWTVYGVSLELVNAPR